MPEKPTLVINSSGASFFSYLTSIFRYKDLLITLSLRDFKVRYAQSFLGFFWTFVQPFSIVIILVMVFDKTLHVGSEGVEYPLYAMSGMALWGYFSFVFSQSGISIINAQSIITKVYFPRIIIPLSKGFVGLFDFGIACLVIAAMLLWYQQPVGWQLCWSPIFILFTYLSSLGSGLLLCALTIRFRDLQYVLTYLLQFGLYLTPVAYPASIVPPHLKWIYFLNPMAGLIEAFRWSLFNKAVFDPYCLISLATATLIFWAGLVSFINAEHKMADMV